MVGDSVFPSIASACKAYGISNKTYNSRTQAGMSPYEAMTKPVHKLGEPYTKTK